MGEPSLPTGGRGVLCLTGEGGICLQGRVFVCVCVGGGGGGYSYSVLRPLCRRRCPPAVSAQSPPVVAARRLFCTESAQNLTPENGRRA